MPSQPGSTCTSCTYSPITNGGATSCHAAPPFSFILSPLFHGRPSREKISREFFSRGIEIFSRGAPPFANLALPPRNGSIRPQLIVHITQVQVVQVGATFFPIIFAHSNVFFRSEVEKKRAFFSISLTYFVTLPQMKTQFLIAAPMSGSGKTTIARELMAMYVA